MQAIFGDLLVSPDYQGRVENLMNYIAGDKFAEDLAKAQAEHHDDDEDEEMEFGTWARPYNVKNGVLTVPVKGMLMNGFPFAFGDWATGYEYIIGAVSKGVADAGVSAIVLDVDSVGGTTAGLFDSVDALYELRNDKPIRAVANESAYSAAYAIASAADDITVTRTGGVGSIGIIARHVDQSEALAARGIKVSFIYAGDHKIDGRPELPLSDAAKERFQARVDEQYDIFVATVARNRDVEEQAVRDTEASIYTARESVENGLADQVGTLDGIVSASAETKQREGVLLMSDQDTSVVEQATHEAAVAAATSEGTATGRTDERARVAAILGHEEAKDRPALAKSIALETDMSPEAAAKVLAAAAKETAEAPKDKSTFEKAMDASGNPELGTGDDPTDDQPASRVDAIFESVGMAKKS